MYRLTLPNTNKYKLPDPKRLKNAMLGELGAALGFTGGPAGAMTGGRPQGPYLTMPPGMRQVLRKKRRQNA